MDKKLDVSRHPCFNEKVRHKFGRIHLPVAPKCNIQCKFCDRKYDCMNESRPGVTSALLTPGQALDYLRKAVGKDSRLSVVGIAGPGDPFANPEQTLETIRLVKKEYPRMLFCLATNGLGILPYVPELVSLGVSHVTITINAVDPAVGARIYSWIKDGKAILRGEPGARLLMERQLAAVAKLKKAGIVVKVNTIIIPGVNDAHIPDVAKKAARLGVDILNCIALCPVENTEFGRIAPPSTEDVAKIRDEVKSYLPLMHHCTRCRADAVGLLGEPSSGEMMDELRKSSLLPNRPDENRPYVAAATREGLLVNQHLGEAEYIWVWGEKDGDIKLMEKRKTPLPGTGAERWKELSEILADCRTLLVSGIGESPKGILEKNGIRVVMMKGLILQGLEAVYGMQDMGKLQVQWKGCGADCSGRGLGCG